MNITYPFNSSNYFIKAFLLVIFSIVGMGNCLSLKGQVKTITYYGQATWTSSSHMSGTVFKTIEITYDGNTPIAIKRGMNNWKLTWENSGEDYETYSATRSFRFNIADNKSAIVEIYNFNGMLTYASYTRTPSQSNEGDIFVGGYNGGSFNGGNNNGNNSRSSNSDQLTCPSCHGSGKCTGCAGRGEYRLNGTLSDCAICNGRGTCRGCYGRGWIR